MTTAIEQEVALPWDYFLRQRNAKEAELFAINSFRRTEWPNILRDLARNYHREVPEGFEPHWVAPARAVLWRHEVVREFAKDAKGNLLVNDDGRKYLTDVDHGWQPSALASGHLWSTAAQVAHDLEEGLRFRPPVNGVDDETLHESAAISEAQGEPLATRTFVCTRHDKGRQEFTTWKAYINHCSHFREIPEEDPPMDVLERIKDFVFYCAWHDKGFNNERHAAHHVQAESKRRGNHPSVDQMRVKKE